VEDDIRSVIVKRFDGIKNRDESAVRAVIDEGYSKFDDWPPYQRQEAAEALQNEFGALKVLSNYNYELKDFQTKVLGNTAIATFSIRYQATMRNESFDITSRVTTVLKKQDSGWKIIHEHLSRFPEQVQQQRQFSRRRFPF
jgi:ketosteroid isomerase-like protein